MIEKKINSVKELRQLIIDFQNPLLIKSTQDVEDMIVSFRDYVLRKYLNLLAASLIRFKNPTDTFGFNFNLSTDRTSFVEEKLTDKLFPIGKKSKCLIHYFRIEDVADENLNDTIRSYLYRIVMNEALGLIKKNKGSIETVLLEDVSILPEISIENDEQESDYIEIKYPLIYSREEVLANPYLFICNRTTNSIAMNLLPETKIEKNRILEWRDAIID